MMQFLAIIDGNSWKPGIGDPSFMGWLTVIAYLAASFLCLACAFQISRLFSNYSGSSIRWLWLGLAVILLLLGINKQLDLQSFFTVIGKRLAIAQGWYEERRTFQLGFILGMGAIMIGGFSLILYFMSRELKQIRLALLGLLFLSSFVLVRAISFHHVDQFLSINLAGLRMNWILELAGIFCIGFSALRYLSKLKNLGSHTGLPLHK